ncbi:MAG: hypothetical protein IK013_00780 [Bacteroidales bacterium]|nr:hypothetical protein [Bacteroidales bacterium]
MEKSSTRRVTIYINGTEVGDSLLFPLFAHSCHSAACTFTSLLHAQPVPAHIPVIRGQGPVVSE